VFRGVFHGNTDVGLTATDLKSLDDKYCWVGDQKTYLGGRANVYEVLFHPFEGSGKFIVHLLALVLVPGLCLLFVWLQARAALRGGPMWPARLFWMPFLGLILLSAPMSASVAIYLWLGFLPASILGLLPVLVVGAPSWSVIERGYRGPPPPVQHQPPPRPPYR